MKNRSNYSAAIYDDNSSIISKKSHGIDGHTANMNSSVDNLHHGVKFYHHDHGDYSNTLGLRNINTLQLLMKNKKQKSK